ncbi:MAG: 7-cyano-7-deazaguanine synthase QueC [Candidatus Polarisedimenticolia bacterium]
MSAAPGAVVLVSGGMDSAVTAAIARLGHEIALLHATYGQRTAARERRAFEALADAFGVPPARRRTLDLAFLAAIGGSALTDSTIAVPETEPGSGGVPITYVPFRNAQLLAAAVAWAEVLDARAVFIGAVEEDSSGYPDCRQSFLEAFERAARLGTRDGSIRVVAPLLHLTKGEIVRRGLELGVPFELTWSCYQGTEEACGRCESCRLRLKGFAEAGARDPIPYAR